MHQTAAAQRRALPDRGLRRKSPRHAHTGPAPELPIGPEVRQILRLTRCGRRRHPNRPRDEGTAIAFPEPRSSTATPITENPLPTARSKSANAVRSQILGELKDDHKRVKKAYRDFQKLDPSDDAQACEELVTQVLDELTLHAAIEEELLYPAAREAIADEHLVDEAEVEHEAMHSLIDQLRQMGPDDDKYAARFTVLCEYTLHHVKEEEGEMFPQLEKAKLDWASGRPGRT